MCSAMSRRRSHSVRIRLVHTIFATRKLLARVKRPARDPVEPTTFLGNWYASALLRRPQQVALFVNETTLLPVFVELAPAKDVAARFPETLGTVLEALDVPTDLVLQERLAMREVAFAKTASRSILGSMNDLASLAAHHLSSGRFRDDLAGLSVFLADTPCSPLRLGDGFPDQAVRALVEDRW